MRSFSLKTLLQVLLVLALTPQRGHAQDVSGFLEEFRAKNHTSPTVAEFSSFLAANVSDIESRKKGWSIWHDKQNPPISREALNALVQAKRDRILRAQIKYSHAEPPVWPSKTLKVEKFEFYLSNSKRRLDRITLERGGPLKHICAYDGESVRFFNLYSEENAHGDRRRSISDNHCFYEGSPPLVSAMLVDAKRDLGMDFFQNDLVMFLRFSRVLEGLDKIDGVPVLVLATTGGGGTPNTLAYLDPARDYSVLRVSSVEDNDTGLIGTVSFERRLSDLQDCGSGIWLPRMTEELWHVVPGSQHHTSEKRCVIKMERASINQAENFDDVFGGKVFPVGAHITDTVEHVGYRKGKDPTISLLESQILLGIGLVLMVTCVIWWFTKERSRHRFAFSLGWLMAFTLAAGVTVGGGVRCYLAAEQIKQQRIDVHKVDLVL